VSEVKWAVHTEQMASFKVLKQEKEETMSQGALDNFLTLQPSEEEEDNMYWLMRLT
jgi:hypothetical protein